MRIAFDRVSKSFGRVPALRDVSLDIADGELFFLLGPSGCGKTTLLRCLAGFERPESGTIRLDGKDVSDQSPHRRNTAMVFQGYALWPHMTVAQNVAFGLEMKGISKSERSAKVRQALELVQIPSLAGRKPNELSGGQQQRVAVARAFANDPVIILADEPTANLDVHTGREMIELLVQLKETEGVTVISATHDMKMLDVSDRILWIRDGRVDRLERREELDIRVDSIDGEVL